MNSPILRAAIIGLGVGERHIFGYRADQRCRVDMLCDTNPAKLAEVGARYPECRLSGDPDTVLDDPDIDVVSIASYDDAHHAQVVRALKNGKHVFVEKPLCLLDDELADVRRVHAARPSLKLSSNLILRRCPRFLRLRRMIGDGELGRIYYLDGDYNYGRIHKIMDGWRGSIPNYSIVHGGGIHIIDLLMWLSGERPEEVAAMGNRICTEGRFANDDMVVSILRFPSGLVAKVGANFGCTFPHWHNLSVYGTEASFIHGHAGASLFRSRDPGVAPEPITDPYPGAAKGDMIPSFIAAILDGGEPEVEAREVYDAMAVSLAIERSVRLGGVVEVCYE